MNGLERRAILATYPDRGPLRDLFRARRLRRSALRRIVAELPASGLVVVAGERAADGLLAHVIARSSGARRVVLFAGRTRRLAAVEASARGVAVHVVAKTIEETALPGPEVESADAVVLTGALADLSRREQERWLERAASVLAPGGVLIVREIDASSRLRRRLARAVDRVSRILDGRRPATGAIRTANAWARLLDDVGFADAHVVPRRPASLDGRCTAVGRRPPIDGASAQDAATAGPWRTRGESCRAFAPLESASDEGARASRPTVPVARGGTHARAGALARSDGSSSGAARGCALCGGFRRRVELRHRDGVLMRCRDCGLVSVDPLPDRATALAQYDADYFRSARGYRDYAAEEANFRATFRRRLRRLAAFRAKGRLLDVGAATGAFLREAHDAGFDAIGVEPSDATAQAARASGLDVRTGSIETAELPAGRFDVVTCFDVVEHLVDPVAGLRRLAAWARPGGLVAVTVPDFGGHWARLSGRRWPFVTPKEHLHYFTRRSIRAAMRAAGLSVLDVSLATTPVSFGSLALRLPGLVGTIAERLLGRLADRGTALPFGSLLAVGRRATTRPDWTGRGIGWPGGTPFEWPKPPERVA